MAILMPSLLNMLFGFSYASAIPGCISVHGGSGIWGLLAAGFFLRAKDASSSINGQLNFGILQGGGWYLLGIQTLMTVALIVWTLVTSWILLKAIDLVIGLRVPLDQELLGADVVEHGIGSVHYDKILHKIVMNEGDRESQVSENELSTLFQKMKFRRATMSDIGAIRKEVTSIRSRHNSSMTDNENDGLNNGINTEDITLPDERLPDTAIANGHCKIPVNDNNHYRKREIDPRMYFKKWFKDSKKSRKLRSNRHCYDNEAHKQEGIFFVNNQDIIISKADGMMARVSSSRRHHGGLFSSAERARRASEEGIPQSVKEPVVRTLSGNAKANGRRKPSGQPISTYL